MRIIADPCTFCIDKDKEIETPTRGERDKDSEREKCGSEAGEKRARARECGLIMEGRGRLLTCRSF